MFIFVHSTKTRILDLIIVKHLNALWYTIIWDLSLVADIFSHDIIDYIFIFLFLFTKIFFFKLTTPSISKLFCTKTLSSICFIQKHSVCVSVWYKIDWMITKILMKIFYLSSVKGWYKTWFYRNYAY